MKTQALQTAEETQSQGLGYSTGLNTRRWLTADISKAAFHRGLVILVLAGVIVRIGFFLEHAQTASFGVPTLDQKYYDLVARMLLNGEDLHQLHGFRPLLYPMFLAVLYKLGGNWGIDLTIFVQHLLGVVTALLVSLTGARLFRNRFSGLIGGALFLLAPVPLYFEGELLIEPSYIALICAGLLLHLRAADETNRIRAVWLWFASGALMVLAAQARPNILVFLAVYPAYAAWCWWQMLKRGSEEDGARGNWSRLGGGSLPLTGLVGALAMAVPWGLVNMKQSDHFHLLPNAGGVALYLGNKRSADGMAPEQERRILAGDRYEDSIEVWAREEYQAAMTGAGRQPNSDPMAISKYWTERTFDEIKADPAAWLRLIAKKTWLTFWNAEIPNNKAFAFLQQEYNWLRLLPVRWVVLLMLAPAGIWLALGHGNRKALFILLMYAALYSAANVAFFVCDRYRYPVYPAMAVLAGGGALALIESIRGRKHKLTLAWAASACMMAAISLPNWFQAKLPSFSRDYMFRSIAAYEKGHFAEALRDVDQSLELDSHEATALHHRGNVLFALNRLDEAKAAYIAALKLSPGESAIWNNLGAALEKVAQPEQALHAFRRATQCKPPSMNAFVGIALLEIRGGRYDLAAGALAELERYELHPSAEALQLRSLIARKTGDVQKAESLERAARRLDAEAAKWTLEQALSPP